jgi:hypothetical protein
MTWVVYANHRTMAMSPTWCCTRSKIHQSGSALAQWMALTHLQVSVGRGVELIREDVHQHLEVVHALGGVLP